MPDGHQKRQTLRRPPTPPFGRVESQLGKTTLGTPDRDSNLILPVIGSPVQRKSSELDHAAIETEMVVSPKNLVEMPGS
uniref:Uncharacterized protein n=1 Tax=Timema bartmani TaxID=61472 RepID=A0A7R9I249_9NEOP|nr:unnamed protein product [Timema bartmani]